MAITMKKGWYIPQLIVIRQNISWIKSYRIGAFWLFHPSRLKYVLNVLAGVIIPVWTCWKYETSNPKETNNLWFHWFFHIFPALMFQSMFQSYQKKIQDATSPDTTELWGLAQGKKLAPGRRGVCVVFIKGSCMYACMYLYIYHLVNSLLWK